VAGSDEPSPFRCPNADGTDDTDHVLARVLDAKALGLEPNPQSLFLEDEPNPFRRYRQLLHSYGVGRAHGLSDADYLQIVDQLDTAVQGVDGGGFRETPCISDRELSRQLGLTSGRGVWIKNETGNVSGSHKGRHLVGVMLWLEVQRRLAAPRASTEEARLAIASCGNAALAAAVVARAAGYPLAVFIPPWANAAVVERLAELGAELVTCPRERQTPGDPCYRRFQEAVAAGAVPFTCQGPDNGLTIEGGETLAWEMVSALLREGAELDRLFIQVGGGALASACVQGLREAKDLGVLGRMPRIHTVQTQGASPLRRAYDGVVKRILDHLGGETEEAGAASNPQRRADLLANSAAGAIIQEDLAYAATHRSEFMWPWEEEPESIAEGILDDETYDWLALVRGMLETGGYPLVVSEATLKEAHLLALRTTGIPVDPTGSAGLAGCLDLVRSGALGRDETVGVLFTGVER
jgi:threonine synthase